MSDEIIIRCCAPTLAAIKTGSLFNCPVACAEEVTEGLRQVNLCLLCKGVCAIPLRIRGGRALVYLYRPAMLERDLSDPLAVKILREAGYPVGNVNRQIAHLIHRLRESNSFPHEIGLFLGYPPVDVRGFMEHKTCKCTGLWKVFESDETQAQRYCTRCRNCTNAYLRRNREGWSLSRLTIQPGQFSYKTTTEERKGMA